MKRHQSHRALTLIEMLIAIAIIGFLAILLFPMGAKLMQRADEAKCQANLRLLGNAILLYAQDHDGSLPYVVSNSSVPGSVDRHWRRQVLPYVGLEANSTDVRKTPFICPPLRKTIEKKGGVGGLPNYGMNVYLENVKLAAIEKPAQTLLATEAKLISGVTPSEQLNESGIKSEVPGGKVHRGGQNILYVDGHIGWVENARILGDFPYASGGQNDVWSPRK